MIKSDVLILTKEDLQDKGLDNFPEMIFRWSFHKEIHDEIKHSSVVIYININKESRIIKNRYGNTQ
jgi:hypothetical protein